LRLNERFGAIAEQKTEHEKSLTFAFISRTLGAAYLRRTLAKNPQQGKPKTNKKGRLRLQPPFPEPAVLTGIVVICAGT
jgi:hypothetical protein